MTLAELQAHFQAGVLAGHEDGASILESVKNSRRADRTTLFGVYVSAYRLRFVEFLVADYPALRTLLGEEAFHALADAYIDAEPSRKRNARWYTSRLPDFMRGAEGWRDNARAIDLARFERALTDAFDAADADALRLDALSAFAPEDWPSLVFGFHPSLILLELTAGVTATHAAAVEEAELPEPSAGAEHVAVWRADLDSVYRQLEPDEFLALSLALEGHAFGDICQMASFRDEVEASPERIAQLLTGWFEEGLVASAGVREERGE
ncbi:MULTISPECIES: HvfC/BufC N-terminal domain-containing protein [Methylosinus]|uniref:DUF2063 domain-containing protein n=1 Tax=Methylosinus trichosporium (strain ATCC 35070 / NCIMB 11131 / UNIQEM 75 / OB3b) TaxID=595536 RepID=A0A2D2D4U3_METT3|nr:MULTISPECIES: DNA-binding domain-containing protein [Methylosinus]ATQ69974.1 DUF2063 domain-containing protein [Methylosinus trichosporium OB3b]OBS51108.1 DUF2063 domain-containing protein [Methylosinus sp. 3S-1]